MRKLGLVACILALIFAACSSSSSTKRTTTENNSSPTTAGASTKAATATTKPGATVAVTSAAATATMPSATNTPAATSTPAATATPKPTATATAPPAKADVQVQQTQIKTDSIGYLHVYGTVINNGQAAASNIQIAISLFDAGGTLLGAASAGENRPIIPAGEISPYAGLAGQIDASKVANTKVQVQFDTFDPSSFTASLYYTQLTISQQQWTADQFVGQVQNTGDKPTKLVNVLGVAYDDAGTVIDVESTYLKLDQLDPGATAPFSTGVYGLDTAPTKFDVFAYGHSVP